MDRHLEAPPRTEEMRSEARPVSRTWLALLVVLALGSLLRLADLDRWGLWTDEYHTIAMATNDSLFTEGIPPDQHPPLYNLLMAQVVAVGRGEAWLRLPSALAGIAAIWFTWKSGVALGRPRLGLVAAALVAFSPLLLWYAREARMYGLASALWAASIYFYIQVWRRDSWLDAAGLALATLAALLTTYASLGLWFLELGLFPMLWLLAGRQWPRLARWAAAQVFILLGLLAWWPYMQRQFDRTWIFNWRLPFLEFSSNLQETLTAGLQAAVPVLLLCSLLALFLARQPAVLHLVRRQARPIAWLIITTYLLVLVAGAIPRGLSIRRQLLVFLPPLILLASWALLTVRRPRLLAAVVALSAVLSLYTFFSSPYEDWRGAFVYLAAQEGPGDQLLIFPPWHEAAHRYYYEGNMPEIQTWERVRDEGAPAGFTPGTRVWVLLNAFPGNEREVAAIRQWFESRGTLEEERTFPTYIRLLAYRLR